MNDRIRIEITPQFLQASRESGTSEEELREFCKEQNQEKKYELAAIAERASRFTGRTLQWSIIGDGDLFILHDDTCCGNLTLKLIPDGGLREVYMRSRHFGLTQEDLRVIAKALRC